MNQISMPDAPRPTVGRLVNFFYGAASRGHNGAGSGPYAALITQVFEQQDGTVEYVNLKVFPPFHPDLDAGSVTLRTSRFYLEGMSYWEWPTRV